MEKFVIITYLYDFYQELLTDRQRNLLNGYYFEDFSLSELSQQYQISRQSIFDTIKKTEQKLLDYEEKLHLFAKHQQQQQSLVKITKLCDCMKAKDDEQANTIKEIITLVEGLINTL